MLKFYYFSLNTENSFKKARFNLIWRFNYVLTTLFIALIIFFIIQKDYLSLMLFLIGISITSLSLLYLYKTHRYKRIYYLIATMGILLPGISINTNDGYLKYGNIAWIIVAVALAYFGLGVKAGKYYLISGLVAIMIHIFLFLNINLSYIQPLQLIDKLALGLEVSIAFSIIFYIIYQYTKLYSESENNVNKKNKVLEKQNNEKELLLKEIHHRVKNNLQIISSLLSLQSNSIENEHAISAIKEGQSRIKSMALLHQKLYQNSDNLSKLNFKSYVNDLIHNINASHGNKDFPINLKIDMPNVYFDIDTAIPLGLIINELCTNSYKYALNQGGELLIDFQNIDNSNNFQLTIKDSGKGLPPEIDIKQVNSLGLKLVSILIRQLNGKLQYEYDNGAKFIISFSEKMKY